MLLVFICLAAFAAGLALYQSARLAEVLVRSQLRSAGFEQIELSLSRPGLRGVRLGTLSAEKNTDAFSLRASLKGARVPYSLDKILSQPNKTVGSIHISSAQISYRSKDSPNDTARTTEDINIPTLPFEKLTIDNLDLEIEGSRAHISSLKLDQDEDGKTHLSGKVLYSATESSQLSVGPLEGELTAFSNDGTIAVKFDGVLMEQPVEGEAQLARSLESVKFKLSSAPKTPAALGEILEKMNLKAVTERNLVETADKIQIDRISLTGNLKEQKLAVELGIKAKPFGLSANGNYDLSAKHGEFSAETRDVNAQALAALIRPFLPPETNSLKLTGGTVSVAARGKLSAGSDLSGSADVNLKKLSGSLNQIKVDSLSVDSDVHFNPNTFWTKKAAAISVGSLEAYSIRSNDIQAEVSLPKPPKSTASSTRKIEFQLTRADVLGGSVSSEKSIYQSGSSNTVVVLVDSLKIENLLKLYPSQSVRATGSIDARLPITIKDGKVLIEDGSMSAEPPGGSIHYSPPEGTAARNPQLALAFSALRNYQYSSMTAKVDYLPRGDLELALSLQGVSPEVSNNQPINLNLNISENIPALIDSLRIGSTLERKLQRAQSEKK